MKKVSADNKTNRRMLGYVLLWVFCNMGLVAMAYQVTAIDGFSYAVGTLLMMLNIGVIGKLLSMYLLLQDAAGMLLGMLGGKFLLFIALLWFLPKLLPVELFSVAVAIFTVAISAACASVPFLMGQPN